MAFGSANSTIAFAYKGQERAFDYPRISRVPMIDNGWIDGIY
jgi:hypothetical protein